jgi:uncharacterized protein YqgC (DUF456 family)
MDTALWILAILLMVLGVAGTVLPALPGIPLLVGGIVLAAWIDNFQRISGWVIAVIVVLAVIGMAVDYIAAGAAAKKAGASRQGIIGAAVGTVAGIFSGLWGLLFMPLVGAAIGEFIARQDALRAGRIGLATWLGLLVGTAAKIAIAFTIIGIFVVAMIL